MIQLYLGEDHGLLRYTYIKFTLSFHIYIKIRNRSHTFIIIAFKSFLYTQTHNKIDKIEIAKIDAKWNVSRGNLIYQHITLRKVAINDIFL